MRKPEQAKSIVLYADDDPDDISFLREAFEPYSAAIELITFGDGIQLLNYLELERVHKLPCLIILDVNMPRLNGKETLRRLRRMDGFEKVPVVLFTTSSIELESDFIKRFEAGFVRKPLDNRENLQIATLLLRFCSSEVQKSISAIGND